MLRDYCSYRTIKNPLRGSSGLLLDDFYKAVVDKKAKYKNLSLSFGVFLLLSALLIFTKKLLWQRFSVCNRIFI